MKNRARPLAYSALAAALGTVFICLSSAIPGGRFVLLFFASLCVVLAQCLAGWRWALGAYAAAAALSLLLAPAKAMAVFFAAFFGYYPLLVLLTERMGNRLLRYGLRLLIFNAVLSIIYAAGRSLLGEVSGGALVLWAGANAAFVLYDLALRQAILYFIRHMAGRIK